MNLAVQISLQDNSFVSCGYIPSGMIGVSRDSSIFNFLRNLHAIFL